MEEWKYGSGPYFNTASLFLVWFLPERPASVNNASKIE
jgi:hypothetical protein